MCTILTLENHAVPAGLAAKQEVIRDKLLGGKKEAQKSAEWRQPIHDILSDETWGEIFEK